MERVLKSILQEVGIFSWKVSDSWRHLRKHLGINESNYFMYDDGPQSDPAPLTPQSSCISIKPVYNTSSVT